MPIARGQVGWVLLPALIQTPLRARTMRAHRRDVRYGWPLRRVQQRNFRRDRAATARNRTSIWGNPGLIGIPRINSTMLREHSAFFGFATALVSAIVVGSVSHWSPIWMAATAIAGIFFFPRCFYGFKEARALRDADFELGSGKSVSWYVEPPPNQLKAKAHAEMRREEADGEPDDTEWRHRAGENDT